MKQPARKHLPLLAAAMMMLALVTPSVTSAASWGVVGSEHTLDASNFELRFSTSIGIVFVRCNSSFATIDVRNEFQMTITSANFGGNCHSTIHGATECNTTLVGTRFPWTATAFATNDIWLLNLHMDVRFDQNLSGTCPVNLIGQSATITGTPMLGVWNPTERAIVYTTNEGLLVHSPFGNGQPVTMSGTWRDTEGTLTLGD